MQKINMSANELPITSGQLSPAKLPQKQLGEYLEGIKNSVHEQSKSSAVIIDAGPLKEIIPEATYDGKIGISHRLRAGEIAENDLSEHQAKSEVSYVPIQPGASVRCVDGRAKKGYNDDSVASFTEPIGPQLAGGTAGTAFAIGITHRGVGRGQRSFVKDYDTASKIDRALGYRPGNHTGAHASNEKIDCGAYDGRATTLHRIIEETEITKKLVAAYYDALGVDFKSHIFEKVVEGSRAIWKDGDYFPSLAEFKQKILEENPDGLEDKGGEHREIDFIENLVQETTQHSNHLNALTDGRTQSFGNDGWYRKMVANEIPAKNEENEIFEMAQITHTLCTARNITNGEVHFKVRQPSVR